MIQFQFFPRSQGITKSMSDVIFCFEKESEKIKSPDFNLSSNEVLEVVRPHLEAINFTCETGKTKSKKIHVPVLFGYNNKIDKAFNADALSADGKVVIEIEAGRATENNQFLKDIFSSFYDV